LSLTLGFPNFFLHLRDNTVVRLDGLGSW